MPPDLLDIIDDRLEKRFESYAQSQNALHQDFHSRMLSMVETQIKAVVNGKIDKIAVTLEEQNKVLDILKEQISPVNDTRKWFSDLKTGATSMAGFIAPWAVIGVALKYLWSLTRNL